MRCALSVSLFFLSAFGFLLAPVALAENPYAKPNNAWISIDGTVKAVNVDTFTLDYGKGWITVEMDDGDRDADAYVLLPGDKVTVTGKIDDDFFQRTTIEASRVYVEKLGTYFYASPVDDEDTYIAMVNPVMTSRTVVQGVVTEVNGDEFELSVGTTNLTVDIAEMPYNPLDNKGYQRIEAGDLVRVSGNMDYEMFEGRELKAKTLVELVN
ncbi:MAG TPA: hypothetical protein VJ974_05460 [Geopsychrobacteraceae bacterium]|nr:hypothetical protein [Geopsychrobacteraceae bacterium]